MLQPSHSRAAGLATRRSSLGLSCLVCYQPDDKLTLSACSVMIVSMFTPEAEVWHENLDMPVNITSVTGLSPLYPSVRCTEDHKICNFMYACPATACAHRC